MKSAKMSIPAPMAISVPMPSVKAISEHLDAARAQVALVIQAVCMSEDTNFEAQAISGVGMVLVEIEKHLEAVEQTIGTLRDRELAKNGVPRGRRGRGAR